MVRVGPDGAQTTLPFTGLSVPSHVAVDSAGDVFVVDRHNGNVVELTPAGAQSLVVASLAAPFGITLDAAGDIYVTDTGHNTVIEVDSAGQSTVPFTGLNSPTGVAVDPAGNVYVANDGNGAIVRLTPDGTQTTIDTKPGAAGIAADAQGNVFYSELTQKTVVKQTPDGTISTYASGFSFPVGLSVVPGKAQTITFTSAPPDHATIGDSYVVSATGGGSGNPVTFTRNASSADNRTVTNDRPNGAKVDFIGAGTCAVFAHQAGNDTYQLAPGHIRQQIKVYKKSQTITFQSTAPAHAVVGGHYDVSATASSGLDVRFTVPTGAKAACTITSQHANAATLSFARPGICTVTAHQDGNATYNAAPKVAQRFRIDAA